MHGESGFAPPALAFPLDIEFSAPPAQIADLIHPRDKPVGVFSHTRSQMRSARVWIVFPGRNRHDAAPMSQKRKHEIACPFCGREQTVELWDALNADEDPGLREELVAGRINRVECVGCRKGFRVDKPLVYRDVEQDLFIHYDPLLGARALPDVEKAFREGVAELNRLLPPDVEPPDAHLVVEWSELVERLFLLEEGLDARLVEHVKYLMYRQNPDQLPADKKNLLFDAQDSTDEQLCFVVQDRATHKLEAVLNFARADYEALVNVFDSGDQLALLEEQFPGPYYNGRLRFLQDQAEED